MAAAKAWTVEEAKRLVRLAGMGRNLHQIADSLGRSEYSVRDRCIRQGIKIVPVDRSSLTPEEKAIVLQMHKTLTTSQICRKTGYGYNVVRRITDKKPG